MFAAASVFVALVMFTLALVYTFHQQSVVDRKLCNGTVANRAAVRDTWVAAKRLVLAGQTDPEIRKHTAAFFDAVLRPIPPLVCVDNQPVPKED